MIPQAIQIALADKPTVFFPSRVDQTPLLGVERHYTGDGRQAMDDGQWKKGNGGGRR